MIYSMLLYLFSLKGFIKKKTLRIKAVSPLLEPQFSKQISNIHVYL